MALRMANNSLFAILLRSPWWYSVGIGLFFIALSVIFARGKYLPFGIFTALPFFAIAGYAGYKQYQQPSHKRVLEVDQLARKMSATEIAEKIASRYSENGYESNVFKGNGAEFELTRSYRKVLLSTKRFKVANTGIEPLKQLVAIGEKEEATGYLYVALGEISEAARDFAKENNIELIQAIRLAAFFDGKAVID